MLFKMHPSQRELKIKVSPDKGHSFLRVKDPSACGNASMCIKRLWLPLQALILPKNLMLPVIVIQNIKSLVCSND